MERLLKGSLILLLMLGLSACSLFSSDEEEVRTAKPLQTIAEEKVRLVEVWSRGVGKGVGKRFESLKPALDGDKVFVSGAEGTVFALERDTGKEVWKKNSIPVLVVASVPQRVWCCWGRWMVK
ncbi:PQQ-binding-like beta-propeller repeat protein [Endozoicomonas sp. GU-1]|uniref:PQQ-binding-like beta-propeller repeat protein n=1 Tax=Endozoicomonas sp. GU-1 TaxID=3009078 RepID=UPI0022B3C153|nr:PQQ-binding-like beta-propeller repeat protein [Endozoicomonas sp. GU-1]WBA83580.1 PQQ-binding-like beta-propeller repeat protein [Endozoicomonas sp. GU-1]